MKSLKGHISKLGLLIVIASAGLFLFNGKAAFAATKTWTGSGGNSNLATAGNWQGGVAPVDGDSLAFGSGSSLTLNNDLSSSIVVDGFDTGRTVSIPGAQYPDRKVVGSMP